MANDGAGTPSTFWDHLDMLRATIIRSLAVTVACAVVAFCFKDALFAFVLAPKDEGFISYRLLAMLAERIGAEGPGAFSVGLINTGLASQFMVHVKTSLCAGVLCAAPYILYELFRFVSPGLYDHERRYACRTVAWGYLLFMTGAAVSYLIVFPLTFRFLGTYQVSAEVTNMISLDSYMGTLTVMTLSMGIVFEMPVVAWLLGRLGIISAADMRRYRRHAIVAILTAAAVITPTSDVLTLLAVSLPMYLLYEASILIVGRPSVKRSKEAVDVRLGC